MEIELTDILQTSSESHSDEYTVHERGNKHEMGDDDLEQLQDARVPCQPEPLVRVKKTLPNLPSCAA